MLVLLFQTESQPGGIGEVSEDDSDDWATEDGDEMLDAEEGAAGKEEEGGPAAAALGGGGAKC